MPLGLERSVVFGVCLPNVRLTRCLKNSCWVLCISDPWSLPAILHVREVFSLIWYFFPQLIVPLLKLNVLSLPVLLMLPFPYLSKFCPTGAIFLFSLNSGSMKTSLSTDHKPCQSPRLALQSWPAWRRNCMLSVRLRLRLGLSRCVWLASY